jgi:hypothetical protein
VHARHTRQAVNAANMQHTHATTHAEAAAVATGGIEADLRQKDEADGRANHADAVEQLGDDCRIHAHLSSSSKQRQ